MKRSTFKKNKEKELEIIETEMKNKVDKIEKERDDGIKLRKDIQGKKSFFTRLLDYNRPRINIFIGIFVSIFQGALMPIFGGVMAKMLFVLMDTRDLN
jgi:hypothetical protein